MNTIGTKEDIAPELIEEFRRIVDLNKREDTARVLFKISTRMLALLAWIVAGGFILCGLPLTLAAGLVVAVLTAISLMALVASRVIMRKAASERDREHQERRRRVQLHRDSYISAVTRALNLDCHRPAA